MHPSSGGAPNPVLFRENFYNFLNNSRSAVNAHICRKKCCRRSARCIRISQESSVSFDLSHPMVQLKLSDEQLKSVRVHAMELISENYFSHPNLRRGIKAVASLISFYSWSVNPQSLKKLVSNGNSKVQQVLLEVPRRPLFE